MKCNHAHECNSTECRHREGHEETSFCASGYCRWAGDTKCVPSEPKETVTNLLTGYVEDDLLGTLVDQIVRVFKEGNVEA